MDERGGLQLPGVLAALEQSPCILLDVDRSLLTFGVLNTLELNLPQALLLRREILGLLLGLRFGCQPLLLHLLGLLGLPHFVRLLLLPLLFFRRREVRGEVCHQSIGVQSNQLVLGLRHCLAARLVGGWVGPQKQELHKKGFQSGHPDRAAICEQ